jgi:hypothetical protein
MRRRGSATVEAAAAALVAVDALNADLLNPTIAGDASHGDLDHDK